MKKSIFIIIFITLITICFLSAEKIHTKNIECHEGFVKTEHGRCKNPLTSLEYDYLRSYNIHSYRYDNSFIFYYKGINCGEDCNFDGTNCKEGFCDTNKLTSYGYTEVKNSRLYNPKSNLSFSGSFFYLNDVACGEDCNIDGTNCRVGLCDKNKLTSLGYTETRNNKIYNPKSNLSFIWAWRNYYEFYLNDIRCGKDCDFDGTNCKKGLCDKNKLANLGYTETRNNKIYNPKSNLSFEWDYDKYKFYLNDVACGYGCNFDGTNCKEGLCDKNKLTSYGYTEIKDNELYNPKNHLYFSPPNVFYMDDYKEKVRCGYKCDLDGKNCENGNCDYNAIKKHGYTLVSRFGMNYSYSFYNPNTHIAFESDDKFYLEGALCGYKCDLDGKNCEKGACTVNDCANGYNKLGVLSRKNFEINGPSQIRVVVCYNNSKYYNVFTPNVTKSVIYKDIKGIDN